MKQLQRTTPPPASSIGVGVAPPHPLSHVRFWPPSGPTRVVFLALLYLGFTPAAQAQVRHFENFKPILQNNIFDSTRRPQSAAPPPSSESARPVRTEEFSYAGAIMHERSSVAFFQGNDPQYNKALKPNETIAGFTITEIRLGYVKLERDGEEMELPTGRRLARRGEEPWTLAPEAEGNSSPPPNRTATARGRSGQPSRSAEAPADAEEILKRLMEQRNQEIN